MAGIDRRKLGWSVMVVLATLVALYSALTLVFPEYSSLVAARRQTMPLPLIAHLVGSLTAMAVGPWQLNARLRQRALGGHRWLGRVYVVGVLIGGLGGLALATRSDEGLVTHIGFGMLAVLWLFTTGMAYRRIRGGDQVDHRRWMIRSYALTLAAVTLRVYIPLSQVVGIPFPDAYRAVAWVCWVPNLIVAEWLILAKPRGAASVAA